MSIYLGDCADWLPAYKHQAQLIYCDPPYMCGKTFTSEHGSFDDRWDSTDHYANYMAERLSLMWDALDDDGSLWVHCDWHCDYILRTLLEDICGRAAYRNSVVWCYSAPANTTRHFPRKHDTLFWYAKPDAMFYRDEVRIPHSVRTQELLGDRKIKNNRFDWTRTADPRGKVSEDWWIDITKNISVYVEMLGYPTEKPIGLMDKILRCCTNHSGLVIDPMCGSGVMLEAAARRNHQAIGGDINPQATRLTLDRLVSIKSIQPALLA